MITPLILAQIKISSWNMMDFSHSLAAHLAVATEGSASHGRLCVVLPGGGAWSGRYFAAGDFTAGAGFLLESGTGFASLPEAKPILLPPHLPRLKALMLGAPLALMIVGYLSDLGLGGLVVNESSSVLVGGLILTLKPAIT